MWATLAPGQCDGSVAKRLAARVRTIIDAGGAMGTGHSFWVSGSVLWCSICGAFAEGCGTMALARPCTGKRVKGDRQSRGQGGRNGLLQQLRNLRAGRHPKTRQLLPPPISIDPDMDTPPALLDDYQSQRGRTYALATESSLSPVMLAMLHRVRKRAADEAESRVVKRRISCKTTPGTVGSSNTLLRTLSGIPSAD